MTRDAENFIPWEQIEPLVKPGMTWGEFKVALLTRVGLPVETYAIRAVAMRRRGSRDPVRLGEGVEIHTIEERDRRVASGLSHRAPLDSPVIP